MWLLEKLGWCFGCLAKNKASRLYQSMSEPSFQEVVVVGEMHTKSYCQIIPYAYRMSIDGEFDSTKVFLVCAYFLSTVNQNQFHMGIKGWFVNAFS